MAAGDIVPVPGAQFEETLASASPDVLRAMIREFAQRMMDADVEVACGAGYGEVSPDRVNSRNGYRRREWDTRAGTIELAIPKRGRTAARRKPCVSTTPRVHGDYMARPTSRHRQPTRHPGKLTGGAALITTPPQQMSPTASACKGLIPRMTVSLPTLSAPERCQPCGRRRADRPVQGGRPVDRPLRISHAGGGSVGNGPSGRHGRHRCGARALSY
jgi:hypothetical protein